MVNRTGIETIFEPKNWLAQWPARQTLNLRSCGYAQAGVTDSECDVDGGMYSFAISWARHTALPCDPKRRIRVVRKGSLHFMERLVPGTNNGAWHSIC
jgi:hypothetical protein